MGWLEEAGLFFLHWLYVLWKALVALFLDVKVTIPQPLDAERKKLPSHLALVLADAKENSNETVEEDAVVDSICEAIRCCGKAGVCNLSVYDRSGTSVKCAERVRLRMMDTFRSFSPESDSSSESDLEYPLTPPASDTSNSRPLSPQECFRYRPVVMTMHLQEHSAKSRRKSKEKRPLVKRRHSTGKSIDVHETEPKMREIKVSIFSYDSSKPAMGSVARTFAHQHANAGKAWEEQMQNPSSFIDAIDSTLLDITHLSQPDLMIVHFLKPNNLWHSALELEGFPPWIMRLTEIHHDFRRTLQWTKPRENSSSSETAVLTEENFRRALDGFASAEMRLGK